MAAERSDLRPWLHLSLVRGLTGAGWRRLLRAHGSPGSVLAQTQDVLTRAVDPTLAAAVLRGPGSAEVQAALDWSAHPARAILTLDDPRYPPALLQSPDPPPLLYAAGRLELLQLAAVAIVGSRNATAQGIRNAEAFARDLAAAGLCVASGMALGVDAAAHRASLPEAGSTIAVLGNGIDVEYPQRNAALLREVATRGLVLSEFPLGTAPLAANFPRRNRIISGLSRGCLVVEAAMASGSLITARLAVDMGRDVFAIPGSIHSPLAKGCHYLIKQGAKLVESVEDVLEELGFAARPARPATAAQFVTDPDAIKVLDALGHDPCDFETLAARAGLPVDRLVAVLMELELDAHISRNGGGYYQRLN